MTNDHGSAARRRLVRGSYNRIGPCYAAWAGSIENAGRERYTQHLLGHLQSDSRVLDLGCGDGSLLTKLLAQRCRVTGVDSSIAVLNSAQNELPNVDFICADIAELALRSSTFDAIGSFFTLTHLPPGDLPEALYAIARTLKPGGLFVGSFGATKDPGSVEAEWLGEPMYFSGLGREANLYAVREAGLKIVQETLETAEEFGRPVTFHWIAAHRPR